MKYCLRAALLAILPLLPAIASMIVDRAPNAEAVAEIFVEPGQVRVEWELKDGVVQPQLGLRPDRPLRPRTLVISPPDGARPEQIGFVVYHRGLPVADLHYLTQPETLVLDWADPWRSHFENRRLRRLYDSPMGVFLYVEPFEVRVEIVGGPSDLGVDAPDGDLRGLVAKHLAGQWRLTVDGRETRPELDRVQFLERRLRTSSVIDPPDAEDMPFATLGAVFVVEREGLPRSAELDWGLFNESMELVAGSVTDDTVTRPAILRPGSSLLTWENLGAVEVPSLAVLTAPPPPWVRYLNWVAGVAVLGLVALLIVIGLRARGGRTIPRSALLAAFLLLALTAASISRQRSARLSEAGTKRIVRALLYNVYRAFDRRQESAVYDSLAASVSGELLTEIYLEARRSLEVESLGGARTRVKSVDIERIDATAIDHGPGFTTQCVWIVGGSVGHWGHIHERRNRYDARLTIRAVNGAWKITGLELHNEERL